MDAMSSDGSPTSAIVHPSTFPPGSRKSEKDYIRAYKACIPCRKRKAKCDLTGAPGVPEGPPCARCRREHRQCIFTPERSRNPAKRLKSEEDEDHATEQNDHFDSTVSNNLRSASHTGFRQTGNGVLGNASKESLSQTADSSLDDPVMRTVVSGGNDALDILFRAATHQERAEQLADEVSNSTWQTGHERSSLKPFTIQAEALSSASRQLIDLWKSCRFVRQGWLTAEEAITLVDLFFKHMCPLSPIINNYYGQPANHYELLAEEPTLCCTILTISSRYHLLPGIGSFIRGALLHERLWQYSQTLIMHTIFGQEKGPKPVTRGVGTIEALLLFSEWHPRSMHFPPQENGFDTDLLMPPPANADNRTASSSSSPADPERWLQDVVEPARRSDRLSWMLLGCAITLAHELKLFDENSDFLSSSQPTGNVNRTSVRRQRARKLLYVYMNHLASRLGFMSMVPQSLDQVVARQVIENGAVAVSDMWQSHMVSWIELTKLVTSVSDTFFPSPAATRDLINSGRYINQLERFLPLLDHWKRQHLDSNSYQGSFHETLFIEYHYVRVYINSLGMQAACERALTSSTLNPNRTDADLGFDSRFIQEVISGSCAILSKVTTMAQQDILRFAPVRIFLRITTSSMFLVKALSLGTSNANLQSALNILDQSVQALMTSNIDELHLAARYAKLLETHVDRLKRGFAVSAQRLQQAQMLQQQQQQPQQQVPPSLAKPTTQITDGPGLEFDTQFGFAGFADEDWLSLPFDPGMAPFVPDGTVDFSGLNEGSLDFVWNLPVQ